MKTLFIVLNSIIIVVFVSFMIMVISKLVKHKKSKIIAEEAIAIINKPIEPTYIETLANKVLFVFALLSIVIALFVTSMVEISTSIIPLYLPLLFINMWFITYEKKLGFIITKDGIKAGFEFIEWRKIKEYNWINDKKQRDRKILKVNRYHAWFPVMIWVNEEDRGAVESLFEKGLGLTKDDR